MEIKPKKIIGFLLLVLGISIIGAALLASYNIFTDKTPVPGLFSSEDFEGKEELEIDQEESGLEQEMRNLVRESVENQMTNIMPPSLIARLLNLISWSIFAGIAIFGGTQFSKIGITLLR